MPFGRKKSLMDRAHDYVEQLSETVIPQLEQAWEQTVDKAGPALADARDKATPLIAEGRALVPVLRRGVAAGVDGPTGPEHVPSAAEAGEEPR